MTRDRFLVWYGDNTTYLDTALGAERPSFAVHAC